VSDLLLIDENRNNEAAGLIRAAFLFPSLTSFCPALLLPMLLAPAVVRPDHGQAYAYAARNQG
jgi:hypothetical protein